MRYDVFTLRGTAEPYDDPTNMLVDITRRLDPDLFNEPVDVDYPASIGPANPQNNPRGVPLRVSVLDGKVNLAAHIRDTSNPNVIVIGYSLGAMVVSAFLEDMAAGAHYTQGLQVSRVVLMSNPRRAPETPGGTYPHPLPTVSPQLLRSPADELSSTDMHCFRSDHDLWREIQQAREKADEKHGDNRHAEYTRYYDEDHPGVWAGKTYRDHDLHPERRREGLFAI